LVQKFFNGKTSLGIDATFGTYQLFEKKE